MTIGASALDTIGTKEGPRSFGSRNRAGIDIVERIAIVGLSLARANVGALETLKAQAADLKRFSLLAADELGASEVVVLSTCNRFEVVFAREEGHLPCEQDRLAVARLLALDVELQSALCFDAGLSAARRLFRIVCSLDSLVVGEDQILAQTRAAFARAEHEGMSGPLLSPLFQRAFQVGKEVRTKTDLSRHHVSVVSLGMDQLCAALPATQRDLCVFGAGEMAQLVVKHAASAGFTVRHVASRSHESAKRLAGTVAAGASTIEEFLRSGSPVHALVSATSAPGYVADATALRSLAERLPGCERLFALDLAVPRDLEPSDDPRIVITDLELLRARADTNRKSRATAACEAEALIEAKLESFQRAALDRRAASTVAEVHGESREIAERELSSLSDSRFTSLSSEQRRAVEEWARAAFGRLEHAPIRAIKRWLEDNRHAEENA